MFAQCRTDQQKRPSAKPENLPVCLFGYFKGHNEKIINDYSMLRSSFMFLCENSIQSSVEGRGQDWERACAPGVARVHKLSFPLTIGPYAYLPPLWLKKKLTYTLLY